MKITKNWFKISNKFQKNSSKKKTKVPRSPNQRTQAKMRYYRTLSNNLTLTSK